MLAYLLEKGANPNAGGILACAIQSTNKRLDIVRLLIAYRSVYEQKFEYIDKETKLPVSKIVRYNDRNHELSEKLVTNLVMQQTPQPAGNQQREPNQASSDTNLQLDFHKTSTTLNDQQQQTRLNQIRHEWLQTVNYAKCEGVAIKYWQGEFGDQVTDNDMH